MQETGDMVRFLGQKDLLEKEMASHSVFLLGNLMDKGAWQAIVQGVERVRCDLVIKQKQAHS